MKGLFQVSPKVSNEWETPLDLFDTLNREFGFTLDVCATSLNAKCKKYFTLEDDGLSQSWINQIVWMNPPYTKEIGLWLKKAFETSQAGGTVVCLIQGRSVDTKWWHNYVMKATEIRIIRDRLNFGQNGVFTRANFSSIVLVFKPFCCGPPILSSINTKGEPI
jgi:phage N-6-adenine-methyltransferase